MNSVFPYDGISVTRKTTDLFKMKRMVFKTTIVQLDYTGPGTTLAIEMNFVMNHAPGAGSLASPVDQQSSMLPLCHGCSPHYHMIIFKTHWIEASGI